jgi:ABC-type dipeptide/oligopeptide/nickel transport system ATPase component
VTPALALALELRDARKEFPARRGAQARVALGGVHLRVSHQERVGLVGESGAGKSSLARAALGLMPLDQGRVLVFGEDVSNSAGRSRAWGTAQLLHQDAAAHLGAGLRVGALVRESARVWRTGEDPVAVAQEALATVGLADRADAHPETLSGGEQRRVGLARVLVARPRLLIADEPTTGLDAALRWDVVALLRGVPGALLLVSHDLAVVAHTCSRVVIMLGGRVVEDVPTAKLGCGPHHPHTWALLRAAGRADWAGPPRLAPTPGTGCPLRTECPWADPTCETPLALRTLAEDHAVACPQAEACA